MRILSLDASSSITGYAIFTGITLKRWGVIDVHSEQNRDRRFCSMVQQIDALIKKEKIDIVVLEDINLRCGNVKTLILLARLQGCILYSAMGNGKPYHLYAPSTWRRLCAIATGSGIKRKELKEQAIALIDSVYHLQVGDDCAEAICIGLAYLKDNSLLINFANLKRSGIQK